MTEDTIESENANDDATNLNPARIHVHDWFLCQLVGWANQFGIEQGITLTVGGAAISGQLISGKRYFEDLAATMMEGTVTGVDNGDELKTTIADSYRAWTAVYDKPEDAVNAAELPQVSFIHLRDARWISSNGSLPQGNGLLWRGKLAAVDGFALGQITQG